MGISLLIGVILVPLICLGASWAMASSARRFRAARFAVAALVTLLLFYVVLYALLHLFDDWSWGGIFLIWFVVMTQLGVFLATRKQLAKAADHLTKRWSEPPTAPTFSFSMTSTLQFATTRAPVGGRSACSR